MKITITAFKRLFYGSFSTATFNEPPFSKTHLFKLWYFFRNNLEQYLKSFIRLKFELVGTVNKIHAEEIRNNLRLNYNHGHKILRLFDI